MKLNLVSMPSFIPSNTSVQIGCLKSYVDREFQKNKLNVRIDLKTYSHSAHLSIPLRAFRADYLDVYYKYEQKNDWLWFIMVLGRFNTIPVPNRKAVTKSLINKFIKKFKLKDTKTVLSKLERATIDFINEDLVPKLDKDKLNIIGFTLTVEQTYSSIYCYLYLKEQYPEYKILFLFGGCLVSFPSTLQALKKFQIDGIAIRGEGELKLKKTIEVVIDNITGRQTIDIDALIRKCDRCMPGINSIKGLNDDDIFDLYPDINAQLKSLEGLPLPDYTEYFDIIRKHTDKDSRDIIKDCSVLVVEGGRGCIYSKCDYCGENLLWCKYRGKKPREVFEHTTSLFKKHKVFNVHFSDNTPDLWIPGFWDLLIDKKIIPTRIACYLRVNHPESFFTEMSLSGRKTAFLGIESLSESLLRKMNKGATVMQNLEAMKYTRELEIKGVSNLIVYHPKSSIDDIRKTKNILMKISHFDKLNLSMFTLAEGSPLYNELSNKDRRHPKKVRLIQLAKPLIPYFTYDYLLPPKKHLSPSIRRGWREFCKWHLKNGTRHDYLNVTRISDDTIVIKENRSGVVKEHVFSGNEAKCYGLCHKARRPEELAKEINIQTRMVNKILRSFLDKNLMVSINNQFLSLALRPKEELINDYYTEKKTR